MSLPDLKSALREASYRGHVNLVSIPPKLTSCLSTGPRVFVRIIAEAFEVGEFSVFRFLPDDWDEPVKARFWALSHDERLEVCGFISGLLHEHVHQIDLLTTPFGANFYGKLAREYVTFQDHWETLVREGARYFSSPLADWLAEAGAGPDETAHLLRSGPLGQANAELRGPALFDEMVNGADARRITRGWGSAMNEVRLSAGRTFPKITVNKVYATIDPMTRGLRYLGPHEILEGRAVALCAMYLWHVTGRTDKSQTLIVKYFAEFYSESPKHTLVLELLAGTGADRFTQFSPAQFQNVLQSAVFTTWYALHAPSPTADTDVLMAVPIRFIVAARAFADSLAGGSQFLSAVEFLDLLDEALADELSFVSAQSALEKSLHGLAASLHVVERCRRPELRIWFSEVLNASGEVIASRRLHGYASWYGLPDNGNVLTGLDDNLLEILTRVTTPPPDVSTWFLLRHRVLHGYGPAATKLAEFTDWFMRDM